MNQKLPKLLRHTVTLLLCLCCVLLPATLGAQSKIKVDFQNTTLSDVLGSISKQSNYKFVYTNDLKVGQIMVSITSDNEPADKLFEKLFEPIGITYVIKGSQVVLTKRSEIKTTPSQGKKEIRGVCVDYNTGETLPGVVVKNATRNTATYTDLDGNYVIEAQPGDVLQYTLIGMEEESATVAPNAKVLNIALKTDVLALDDVVVTGYQTLSKERATGSFTVISSKKLQNKLQPSVKSIIEGQSAGLVLTKDGEIEIRGVSTFTGVKDPLIVVDGYPLIGDGVTIESINPDNIESLTVLKDAVAASIYGARASNGVIVITTKHAAEGGFTVGYKGTYGVTLKPDLRKLNRASTEDYMDAELDLYNMNPSRYLSNYNANARLSDYFYYLVAKDNNLMSATEADAKIAALRNNDAIQQLNDYVIRPKESQQHNVTISGGTKTNLFNGVMRYAKEYGHLVSNDNSSLTVDINNTWRPKKWFTLRIFSNVSYTTANSTKEQITNFTGYDSGGRILPYTQLYDANGNMTPWEPVPQRHMLTYNERDDLKPVTYHPATDLPLGTIADERLQVRMGGDISVTFTDFLSGSVGGSWVKGATKHREIFDNESFTMRTSYNMGTSRTNSTKHYIPDGGRIDENRGTIESFVIRGQLNYKQSFDDERHRITAIVGGEISKDTYERVYLPSRLGYDPVSATFNNGFNAYDFNNNIGSISNDMLFSRKPLLISSVSLGSNYALRDNRFVSWYGNGSYEFNSKYILSGSVRLDLTNFFGTDPKYRYKPTWSVGGTWKISEEDFFEDLKDTFSMFNLRASYGVNGNISLSNTPYLILSVGSYNTTTHGISYGISSYPNNQLRWERTGIIDVGLDFSLFRGRVNGTFDYYNKKSTDLIASEAIDETRGASSMAQNVGAVTNEGFEITINSDVVRGRDFIYNTILALSYNRSNVDHYLESRPYFSWIATSKGSIMMEGYPMNGIWGGRFSHLNDKGIGQYLNSRGELVTGSQLKPEDAVFLGTIRPKYDLSWTNSFRYKNFEASFMFIGKFGHKYRKDCFNGSNYSNRHVGERWKQPGDEAHTIYPVINSSDYSYFPYSDVLVGNASFVRLRDFTLSYYLPDRLVNTIGLQDARVYFQTRNLFYITAKGVDIDPETFQLNTTGATSTHTEAGYSTLPLRPEFYIGLSVNL